jgi:hypothetical protein
MEKSNCSINNDPKDVPQTQINFIDMPNAVQSEVAAINVSNLK